MIISNPRPQVVEVTPTQLHKIPDRPRRTGVAEREYLEKDEKEARDRAEQARRHDDQSDRPRGPSVH